MKPNTVLSTISALFAVFEALHFQYGQKPLKPYCPCNEQFHKTWQHCKQQINPMNWNKRDPNRSTTTTTTIRKTTTQTITTIEKSKQLAQRKYSPNTSSRSSSSSCWLKRDNVAANNSNRSYNNKKQMHTRGKYPSTRIMLANCNGRRATNEQVLERKLIGIGVPKVKRVTQLQLVILLLSYCYGTSSTVLANIEFSAKLSNCYDIQHGFEEQPPPTTAPSSVGGGAGAEGGPLLNANLTLAISSDIQEVQPPALLPISATAATLPMLPPMHSPTSGWKCCCWNATNQDEVECRCEGEALTRVPQTLTVPIQRLTIASAGLPRLRSTGLKVYAGSLLDIVLTDLKQLDCIQDGAFASLRLLRTIYISHAPKLTFLSKDVFQDISDTIKIIRIINSGLIKVPDLIHLPPANILQMIDLDNNHITRIDMKSIKIKTDQLILANNEISYIDDSAFFGSQIAKLILKENRNLQQVHPNAFSGMSMQQLDLSSTSLVRLPSAGLQDIEELRIENTHTLKTIPSIYNFKNLQRAYLTHSFHCCAFKYPSRHDPRRHAERTKEIEKWQRQCTKSENDIDTARNRPKALRTTGGGGGMEVQAEEVEETDGRHRRLNVDGGSSSQEWHQPTDTSGSNNAKFNLAMTNPTNAGGVFYSRLERNELLAVSSETTSATNETEDSSDYTVNDDDYMSDTMIKDIGIFHDQITINLEENQLEEYCGNFTFRKFDVDCYPIPNALNPCEDVMGYQWLRISVWIVVALAVVGNVAVLVVILSIKSETASVPRFLMSHLAFADLCLGLYLLLIACIDAHSMGEYFNYAYDWQYGAGCKVAGFLTVFASHLSVFTLTVITIERWLAITHAMYLNKRIKLRPAAYIMVAGWIYSIVMSMFPLFGISNYSSTSICLPFENRDPFDTVYLVSVLGLNGAAFFIIAICYAQIYMSLGKETRHAHNTHLGEMTIAKKMALLVFTNFSCWAPIAFFGLTALFGYPLINVTKSKILLVFFYPLNSCADPYLYAILTSQYRQDLYTLLSKFDICKKQAKKYKNSLSTPGTTNFTIHGSSIQRHNSLSPKIQLPETQLMLQKHEDFV